MISIPSFCDKAHRPRLAAFRQRGEQVRKPLPEFPE
jgi:hypothetical protein